MLLATPMVLLPEIDQFTANTETFMLLPLLGMVAVYVRESKGKGMGQNFYWFVARWRQ